MRAAGWEEALLRGAVGLLGLPGAEGWRWLGTKQAVLVYAAGLAGILLWRYARGPGGALRAARAMLAAGLVLGGADAICTHMLKPTFARARPCLDAELREEIGVRCGRDFSFPSGHATTSAAAAALLGGPGLAGCALVIGVSRVALAQHWPGDVLAGWLLGAMIGRAGRRLLPGGGTGGAATG